MNDSVDKALFTQASEKQEVPITIVLPFKDQKSANNSFELNRYFNILIFQVPHFNVVDILIHFLYCKIISCILLELENDLGEVKTFIFIIYFYYKFFLIITKSLSKKLLITIYKP